MNEERRVEIENMYFLTRAAFDLAEELRQKVDNGEKEVMGLRHSQRRVQDSATALLQALGIAYVDFDTGSMHDLRTFRAAVDAQMDDFRSAA